MPYLVSAVVVVGALGLLNLLLTLGVVRRLRELEPLARAGGGGQARPRGGPIPAPGYPVGEFRARTTTGELVGREDLLADQTLVAFFSVGCPPCIEAVPRFVPRAAAAGSRNRVLAVVQGGGADAAGFVEPLERVARVVVEDERGPVSAAFGVTGSPAYCLVDGSGTMQASGFKLDEVLADALPGR